MTEEEARKIQDPTALPWDTPCFVFVTGRFYLGMWFVEIPKHRQFPKGGNITFQCWRYANKPDEWIVTYRFRFYAGEKIWNSADKKSWHCAKMGGDEKTILATMRDFFPKLSGTIGLSLSDYPPDVHELLFQSDSEKALDVLAKQKPFWMHIKLAT